MTNVLRFVLVLMGLAAVSARADDKVLNVYCWDEYLPKDVLEDFAKRTGTKVTLTLYDSNEAMLAMPYFFGTTGIGFNKQAVKDVDSWGVMFDPKYSGKIMMLNDMRECFGAALRVMGKGVNEKDPGALRQAGEMLKRQKRLVKSYDSDTFAEELRRGSVVLAQGFNGQVAKLVAEEPDKFGYVVPKEGGTVWIDNVCIPAKAANPDGAHAFINYLLEPEVGARIVNAANYASANKAAREKVKPEILNNPSVYPPDEVLKRCEFMEHLGKAGAVEAAIWREIKSE